MSSSLGPFVRPAILGLVLHAHKIPPLEYLIVVRSASGALVLFERRSGLSLGSALRSKLVVLITE